MSAPPPDITPAAAVPATQPAPAPQTTATTQSTTPGKKSRIDQADVDDWKTRFNHALDRSGDVVRSKSAAGAQAWHTSFFECFKPFDTCFMSCCLPCVTFGKTHHRIRKSSKLEGYEPINASCLLYCGAGCVGVPWVPLAMQRMNIREKYNLEGSCLEDLALSYCCHCCTLVQADKEAAHREDLLTVTGGSELPYQANTAEMQYPAQPAGSPAPAAVPAVEAAPADSTAAVPPKEG